MELLSGQRAAPDFAAPGMVSLALTTAFLSDHLRFLQQAGAVIRFLRFFLGGFLRGAGLFVVFGGLFSPGIPGRLSAAEHKINFFIHNISIYRMQFTMNHTVAY
jgi:hypothetical protein